MSDIMKRDNGQQSVMASNDSLQETAKAVGEQVTEDFVTLSASALKGALKADYSMRLKAFRICQAKAAVADQSISEFERKCARQYLRMADR